MFKASVLKASIMEIYRHLDRENFKRSIKTYFEVCNHKVTSKKSKLNFLKEKLIFLLYISTWSQNKINYYYTMFLYRPQGLQQWQAARVKVNAMVFVSYSKCNSPALNGYCTFHWALTIINNWRAILCSWKYVMSARNIHLLT